MKPEEIVIGGVYRGRYCLASRRVIDLAGAPVARQVRYEIVGREGQPYSRRWTSLRALAEWAVEGE